MCSHFLIFLVYAVVFNCPNLYVWLLKGWKGGKGGLNLPLYPLEVTWARVGRGLQSRGEIQKWLLASLPTSLWLEAAITQIFDVWRTTCFIPHPGSFKLYTRLHPEYVHTCLPWSWGGRLSSYYCTIRAGINENYLQFTAQAHPWKL